VNVPGPPRLIFVIRHGEKQESPSVPLGIDVDGVHDEHSLVPRGWQRAGALAQLFASFDRKLRPGLETPDCLRSPFYRDASQTSRRRTHQTLHPISQRLELTIHSTFAEDQQQSLVADILAEDREVTLVCWEHKHIPLLARCIPTVSGTIMPATWPDECFDVVWRFSRQTKAEYCFSQLPQRLLQGDSDTVIP